MSMKLRKIEEQVIVITGASSGIGLATAKMAAKRGARVVLTSRDAVDLGLAVEEIRANGGTATHVAADVANADELQRVADLAIAEFGGFDTWVNNAGVSIYGRVAEVPLEDVQRLFETNYFGMVNGSLIAARHLRERGGAIINIGSIASDRAIPLQGHYSASKHAVKAFTDALRMELEEEGVPIVVTLVKPGAIDTPFPEHARNYMEAEPRHPPPVYTPDVVARTILECAESPHRDIVVGGGGRMITAMGMAAPRLTDRYMEATMFDQQMRDEPGELRQNDTLYAPRAFDARERGDQPGHIMKSSLYTQAKLHPVITTLAAAGAVAVLGRATRLFRRSAH